MIIPKEIQALIEGGYPLNEFLNPQCNLDRNLLLKALSKTGINSGLYAFWWSGDYKELKDNSVMIHTSIEDKKIELLKTDFPKYCIDKKRLPLYIGKTSNFQNRISQHLCLGTEVWKKETSGRLSKPTTSCQFRSGIEHIFNYIGLKKNLKIFDKVTLTFVPIPNENKNEGIKNRFYLEDLAIGLYRPWFNIDSER